MRELQNHEEFEMIIQIRDLWIQIGEFLLKKDPLPQKKYNVKRNYDKKAINDYGESYYDIVKTRVRDAHDALIRNGFSEDVKRLQEPLSAVSIKETG